MLGKTKWNNATWIFASLLLICSFSSTAKQNDIGLQQDVASSEVNGAFKQGSHVKLYIPNLPYVAISHAINAALLRPANNEKGWRYDLATSHRSENDVIWEFDLRQGVTFQDGTPFNADSVIENVKAFQRQPFTFSKFSNVLSHAEKIDNYTVRFHMKEPYGAFPYDAIWLQFYTSAYLEKFGWNGKPTCPNLAEPGLYGLGPYVLTEGYVEGDRRSPIVELVANKNYWGDDKPKVERITVNLDIESEKAFSGITNDEGVIDVMPIAFSNQVETILSDNAKLASTPSKNNYAMHFNLISGNPAITNPNIRKIINQAIDQEYLLNLSMLGEGVLSPTMVSPNFYKVDSAITNLNGYLEAFKEKESLSLKTMKKMVSDYQVSQGLKPTENLVLKVVTKESFMFLIKDIKYFLSQVNIDLVVEAVPTEEETFQQLHVTWKSENTVSWDLLLWGNTNWYKHPWSAFFVYLPSYAWSTLPPDSYLVALIDQLFIHGTDSKEYVEVTSEVIRYAHKNNLMVFLPTPNNVFAINKEVHFTPGSSAFIYLRDIQVTDYHWSLRHDKALPTNRKNPIEINRTTVDKFGQP